LYLQLLEQVRTDVQLVDLRQLSSGQLYTQIPKSTIFPEDGSVVTFLKHNLDKHPIVYCGSWREIDSSLLNLTSSDFEAYPYGFCYQIFSK
jgi:hypothetical protein